MPIIEIINKLNLAINTLNAISVRGKTDLSHMLGTIATLEGIIKQLQVDEADEGEPS